MTRFPRRKPLPLSPLSSGSHQCRCRYFRVANILEYAHEQIKGHQTNSCSCEFTQCRGIAILLIKADQDPIGKPLQESLKRTRSGHAANSVGVHETGLFKKPFDGIHGTRK
ncbi:unnamed protein product, partial [Vitis vinifera]|uniref:Uncharacterized protein n=1 Tax=Vitis vinifera TaxID=29760 RepID=D7TZC4_VITVI